MQTYDIVMLIVLAATTIFGAIKGFAWQVASLASIVASYFVAYAFRQDVAKMINADPPWNQFLAMLLLYFGSSFVIWMAFRLVSTSIDKVRLKEFDRHLGAGLGLLKGMILCLLITMFAMSLLGDAQQQRIANSKSGLYISRVLANSGGLLPSEIKQIVGPYIDNVGQRLQDHQTAGTSAWPTSLGSDTGSAGQGDFGNLLKRAGEAATAAENLFRQGTSQEGAGAAGNFGGSGVSSLPWGQPSGQVQFQPSPAQAPAQNSTGGLYPYFQPIGGVPSQTSSGYPSFPASNYPQSGYGGGDVLPR